MSLLPVVLLALGAWMLSSLTSQSGFVMNTATPRGSKVAMRGFKDDFYAWKETLSSEDQALLLKQAQNVSWQKLRRMPQRCFLNLCWILFLRQSWDCEKDWKVVVSTKFASLWTVFRSSTRSSVAPTTSRQAWRRTRSSPSERCCRNSSTPSVRTTRRMPQPRFLTMTTWWRKPARLG